MNQDFHLLRHTCLLPLFSTLLIDAARAKTEPTSSSLPFACSSFGGATIHVRPSLLAPISSEKQSYLLRGLNHSNVQIHSSNHHVKVFSFMRFWLHLP